MKDLPECELSHVSSYSKHPHMSFRICCICRAFHRCEFFHDTPALFSLGSLLRKTNKYAAAPPCGWSSAASTHIDCSNSFHIGDRQTSQVWRLQEDPRATCSSSGTAPPKSDSLWTCPALPGCHGWQEPALKPLLKLFHCLWGLRFLEPSRQELPRGLCATCAACHTRSKKSKIQPNFVKLCFVHLECRAMSAGNTCSDLFLVAAPVLEATAGHVVLFGKPGKKTWWILNLDYA